MSLSEDVKKYLPQYLSDNDSEQLFAELKNFPNNIDSRFYSNSTHIGHKIIYQGDSIDSVKVYRIPNMYHKNTKVFIISNTCDIDTNNKRIFPMRIMFAPIIEIKKIYQLLSDKGIEKDKINVYLDNIKKQKITNAFYLPKMNERHDESIVFFDHSNSYPIEHINRDNLNEMRIFSLSNYGFYIFLIKLSIHFTRIREGVNR